MKGKLLKSTPGGAPDRGSGRRRRLTVPSDVIVTMGAMRAPKILAVASAADLDFRYGCTPAWWQLWKGMAEAGVDLIVTPYRGRAIESPWWRTAPNPLYREAEALIAKLAMRIGSLATG